MADAFSPVSVVVPSGMLGVGISEEQVEWGIAQGALAIAVDAGSTDSGPSCLATGISKLSRDAIKRDLTKLIRVALKAGKPLIVGSCGTAGTDMGVDWTRDIALEAAAELRLKPKIAVIYSEQDKAALHRKLDAGRISALAPAADMTHELIDACAHIVALLGPEPFMAALNAGADIILAGRTTDTAILAAVPLMHGAGAGPAWHAAKTAECGGVCTVKPREGGVLITVGREYFDIEPLNPDNACTPNSVSAHMLYENSDPFRLFEPGGVLDVSASVYTPIDARRVRVTCSEFEVQPYTMKLEGARSGAFQTLILVGIEDPVVLGAMDEFLGKMQARLDETVRATFPAGTEFDLSLRPYGWNAVSGRPVQPGHVPQEVGLMLVVTAPTQELATRIAKTCNPIFFHFPLHRDLPMPTYAFPFSPAEIERGQVHEFMLNHILEIADPMEMVRMEIIDLAAPKELHDA